MSIYLDNAATVPLVEPAINALTAQMRKVGNASSLHSDGRAIRKDIEDARLALSQVIDCEASEIIFTGSGTEADNLAVKGFFWKAVSADPGKNIILTSPFEHHAIKDPIEWLVEHDGAKVVEIPVGEGGVVNLEFVQDFIKSNHDSIALITVMHSNNEIGTLQPIAEIVNFAGEIPVHTDAVQSFGKVDFSFAKLGVTAATISGHKIGAPLGIGALILKRGIDLTPVLHGGGQEREIRSGTLNAPAIVAFAAAAQFAAKFQGENRAQIEKLRDNAIARILESIPGSAINGNSAAKLPGIINVAFEDTESEALLLLLDSVGISASAGSACSAGVSRPSHVLLALGRTEDQAMSALRFSIGSQTTLSDIDRLIEVLPGVVEKARSAYQVKKGRA